MCGSMVDIQSATAEIRRGKKKKDRRRNHRAKMQWPALLHRAAIKSASRAFIVHQGPYSLVLISGLQGRQPAGDISRKPGSRLPLLSAMPAVTFPASLGRYQIILLDEQRHVCVNNLHGIAASQWIELASCM